MLEERGKKKSKQGKERFEQLERAVEFTAVSIFRRRDTMMEFGQKI